MKFFLAIIILFTQSLFALPQRKFTKTAQVSSPSIGINLDLIADISMPDGQKLNLGVKSKLDVYESVGGDWKLVDTVNFNDSVIVSGIRRKVNKLLKLSKIDSDIAIDAIVYHCPIENGKGSCFIDKFQRILKRKSKNENSLEVHLVATKD